MLEAVLKKGKEKAIERGHTWIYSGAFESDLNIIPEGELLRILSKNGQILGTGFYQQGRIGLKLLTHGEEVFDEDVLTNRLEKALAYRQGLGLPDASTNAFRLVNGEGDRLPGLIIDIYSETAVIQCYNPGMHQMLPQIVRALERATDGLLSRIYDKSSSRLPGLTGKKVEDRWLKGETGESLIVENGLRFWVDVEKGQKTGFFLDQRDNRRYLSKLSKDKTVLNTFSYTGAFSIYALEGNALRVDSVEISGDALAYCERNLSANGLPLEKHRPVEQDAFDFLGQNTESYDLIILDPPAFAKSIHKRHNAVIAYKRLNAMAIKRILPGGIILTFSCSQVVNSKLFQDTIRAAGIEAGRNVRIMRSLGQPFDHPVDLFHPETRYLKGVALFVE